MRPRFCGALLLVLIEDLFSHVVSGGILRLLDFWSVEMRLADLALQSREENASQRELAEGTPLPDQPQWEIDDACSKSWLDQVAPVLQEAVVASPGGHSWAWWDGARRRRARVAPGSMRRHRGR